MPYRSGSEGDARDRSFVVEVQGEPTQCAQAVVGIE
jgi:hypothetical protein